MSQTKPLKQFDITAQDGRKFSVKGDTLPELQPEWGKNPTIVEIDLAQHYTDEDTIKAKKTAARVTANALQGKSILTNVELQDAVKALLELTSFL